MSEVAATFVAVIAERVGPVCARAAAGDNVINKSVTSVFLRLIRRRNLAATCNIICPLPVRFRPDMAPIPRPKTRNRRLKLPGTGIS